MSLLFRIRLVSEGGNIASGSDGHLGNIQNVETKLSYSASKLEGQSSQTKIPTSNEKQSGLF